MIWVCIYNTRTNENNKKKKKVNNKTRIGKIKSILFDKINYYFKKINNRVMHFRLTAIFIFAVLRLKRN